MRDRGVAPLRLLAQRHEDDVVEVAAQPPAQAAVVRRLRRRGLPHRRAPAVETGTPGGRARPLGLLLQHRLLDLAHAVRADAVGQAAGQQDIEQDAEGVDVARRSHRPALDLLGAGVVRRHQALAGPGELRGGESRALQELGDPEVEQVRPAVLGGPAVEQAGDVGMVEGGEDLPLGAEALQEIGAVGAIAEDLDRDLLAELAVGPRAEVDAGHAPFGEPALHAPGAEALAHPAQGGRWRQRRVHRRQRRLLEEIGGSGIRGEE
jgi:hypothetical protein